MSPSSPRRLEMDELEPALRDALLPRVTRLGYLGEFFKCMGHQPHALRAFVEFTESSKQGLPKNLVEVIALTVATKLGNAYERNQHERLSVRSGLGRDWVSAVEALDPANQGAMSAEEKQIQALVLTLVESHGAQGREQFERSCALLGDEAGVAVLMVVTRYVAHALIVNTLELAPPVPSIFEDGFNG